MWLQLPQIAARKLFHALALFLFFPVIAANEIEFLAFSLAVRVQHWCSHRASALEILTEGLRAHLSGCGKSIRLVRSASDLSRATVRHAPAEIHGAVY